jgi:hypothetical protein
MRIRNKRGGLGNFISMFVAIIVIVIILLGFIFISGVFKKFSEKPAAVVFFGEDGSEKDFFNYMDDEYGELAEVRVFVAGEKSVDDAIKEAEYDEE